MKIVASIVGRSRFTLLVAGFVVVSGALAGTTLLVARQQSESASVSRTLEAERLVAELFGLLQDAETGQRGYLLTGDETYLQPYTAARTSFESAFDKLEKAISDEPTQRQTLMELRRLAADKFTELNVTIEMRRAGRAEEALKLVQAGAGKTLMERLRALTARLDKEEERLLAERQAKVAQVRQWLQISTTSLIALLIVLAGSTLMNARALIRQIGVANDSLSDANAQLVREAAQREALEEQLRQSQKMEAIGQLTGGLAHDFNNMLGVVIGNLSLLKRRIAAGRQDIGSLADAALEGADRAATLTQRLLAFARQQPLKPESIDANRFVAGVSDLLHRTLGASTQVETVLAAGLWRTYADAMQLENAILNLAVNARDAMPEGGRLTIETANAHLDDAYAAAHAEVPAGQYVMLAVSDTGTGMSPEVMRKAFDPFFTTKDAGRGTGLGLSQVYGFVKQSGGHVKIYSEIGEGTTIKIYLPRFVGEEVSAKASAARAAPAGSMGEVILVVEDEERVRQLSVQLLRELGYTVLHAEGGLAALRVLDEHPEVALLFTDIVMPEINGRKLADEALQRRPDLKVLYTTGYTRNAIVHNGMLDVGVNFISKPFTLDQLAHKVREVLGRQDA